MKKTILALIVLLTLSGLAPAAGKMHIVLQGNYLLPSSAEFKDVYGSGIFGPGLTVEFDLFKRVYAWAGGAWYSKTGTTIGDFQEETKTTRVNGEWGLGLRLPLGQKTKLNVFAGGSYVHYKEEAFNDTVKGSAFGFTGGVALQHALSSRLFLQLGAAYVSASDEIDQEGGGTDVKLGGVRTMLGLGISL